MKPPHLGWVRTSILFSLVAFCSSTLWAQESPSGPTILRLSDGTANPADKQWSMWRYYEVWQTDVASAAGAASVRVDAFVARKKNAAGGYDLVPANKITGSDWPAADWHKPEFDDSAWMRKFGDLRTQYRSLSMMCIRGKFEVLDPGKAADLSLSIAYEGGVVVYLNGQEAGRVHLPTGEIANDTLADDYPREDFVDPEGNVYNGATTAANDAEVDKRQHAWGVKLSDDDIKHIKDRTRHSQFTIPRKFLRKGVNVLAIEAHRSAAIPEMFTFHDTRDKALDTVFCLVRSSLWWNRVSIDDVRLNAPQGADWLVANSTRPPEMQVYVNPIMMDVNLMDYADPCEPIGSVRLSGGRNGHYSGEVVVSSTKPIDGLKVAVSDLVKTGTPAKIPAADITLRYAKNTKESGRAGERIGMWAYFDPLIPVPASIPKVDDHWTGAPIWVTVNVPADTVPGDYVGKVVIEANGLKGPVAVPIHISVSWYKLPDPSQFTTHFSSVESPDSLALYYNVPMWSEAHWKLIDESFALLGELGTKDIYIPIVPRTHFGNEHGMVRWVKGADGKYTYDLSIMERYLDTATKHLGKMPVVCMHMLETTAYHNADGLAYTEMDPVTHELTEKHGPKWGTPESVEFLKPLFAALHESLAKRGLADSMCVGFHAAGGAGPEASPKAVADVEAAWPEVQFLRLSHMWYGDTEYRPNRPKWKSVAVVAGAIGVFWDPDEEKPIYGWRAPTLNIIYPRTTNSDYAGSNLEQNSFRPEHRFAPEGSILSGRRQGKTWTPRGNLLEMYTPARFEGMRGFGPLGADFWPVLKGGFEAKDILGRYGEGYAEGGWGTISLNVVVQSIIDPGTDGPISSVRLEMLREGMEEAEARIYVQNAILDDAPKAKLGPALAETCKNVCDDRTRGLRYLSEFWTNEPVQNRQPAPDMFVPGVWEQRSKTLYDTAAEVAKVLDQK